MMEPALGGLRLRTAQHLLLALVLVFAVSCSDSPTTSSPETGGPLFAIADGGHGTGNPDVFFLEPLTEFDATNPEFDGMPNPNLAPTAVVCALDATEANLLEAPECLLETDPAFQVDSLPMTYDATGGFYRASLKDVAFDFDTTRMYRIDIVLATLRLNAYRDVDPDYGPATASCAGEDFCQFNATGSAQVPIKVIIENNAACRALDPGFDPDEDVCVTASLDGGQSLVAQKNGVPLAAATPDSGATLSIQSCKDLRDRGNDIDDYALGRVDLMTYGACVEIDALDFETVSGVAELCDAPDSAAAGGLTSDQVERLTIHRFSFGDDHPYALAHGEASNCAQPAPAQGRAYQFSKMQRFARAARRTWRTVSNQVSELLQPTALNACNRGCASTGDFRSSYQVAGPAAWDFDDDINPGGDLGSHEVGTVVTATANVFDSGELEGESTLSRDPYEGLRVTVTVNGVRQSEFVYSDANGVVAQSFAVEAGPNTVTFEAIGAGSADVDGDGVNDVLAPSMTDPDGSTVELSIDTLTFTAIGTVPLEFVDQPGDIYIDESTGTATLTPVRICTVGDLVDGIAVDSVVAVTNNGSWVELTGEALPQYTGGGDPYDAGCITFESFEINKTGSYRLVVNPVYNDRGKVVDGDAFSEKFNTRPPEKKE